MFIKFKLSPGQMAPDGSTGVSLSDGWLVWEGETFSSTARLGRLTPQDPAPAETYEYAEMTQEEINQYLTVISGTEEDGGEG